MKQEKQAKDAILQGRTIAEVKKQVKTYAERNFLSASQAVEVLVIKGLTK
ncbi:hypothetical protein AB1K32_25415 [Metabacillus dongyingensis]